jgi:hypothetical protein
MLSILKLAIALSFALAVAASAEELDLTKPEDLLKAYVKTVGDLSGKDVFGYGSTIVFAKVPGEKGKPLFNMEVVGVARYVPIEGGWRRLQREIAFYTDLETHEILTTWDNPLSGRAVKVVPVQNDPVNRSFVIGDGEGFSVAYDEYSGKIIFHREVMLRYPSPLTRAEYPLYSQDDWYEAAELFNNYVARADLENPDITSAPEYGSWSRFGPWLPWMEMADAPGMLVYHGNSHKLMAGAADIPPHLRAAIEKDYPKYLEAPESDYGPDQTSWTFYKKLLDAEKAQE